MNNDTAIKILKEQKAEYLEEWVDYSGVAEAFDMAIEALEQEPSCRNPRQVDLKRGKWIDVECQIGMQCSECGKMCNEVTLHTDMTTEAHWNYCPNCGCAMERSE